MKQKKYEKRLETIDPVSAAQGMEKHYSDRKFWDKLKKYGKQIGRKTVYYSLLLFYTAKSPAVPKSSKMIVVGALSYLILPVDLIPDFIPVVGLADDASVIAAAVYKIAMHIDDDIKNEAKSKLNHLFGEDNDEGIDEVL